MIFLELLTREYCGYSIVHQNTSPRSSQVLVWQEMVGTHRIPVSHHREITGLEPWPQPSAEIKTESFIELPCTTPRENCNPSFVYLSWSFGKLKNDNPEFFFFVFPQLRTTHLCRSFALAGASTLWTSCTSDSTSTNKMSTFFTRMLTWHIQQWTFPAEGPR